MLIADVNDMWTWGGIRRVVRLMGGERVVHLRAKSPVADPAAADAGLPGSAVSRLPARSWSAARRARTAGTTSIPLIPALALQHSPSAQIQTPL